MHRVGLPAPEAGGGAQGPDLEEQDGAPALRELAGEHPAPRAGADDHHVEALAHPAIPR